MPRKMKCAGKAKNVCTHIHIHTHTRKRWDFSKKLKKEKIQFCHCIFLDKAHQIMLPQPLHLHTHHTYYSIAIWWKKWELYQYTLMCAHKTNGTKT